MTTPNRIVLISNGRHEEYPADNALIQPGMLCQIQSDGGIVPHAISGGAGPVIVAKEQALAGGIITTLFASGDIVPVQAAAKMDKLLMLLAIGQNVARGTKLMSAGDGTLTTSTAVLSSKLYQIVAPSSTIASSNTDTAFSNGSYAIAAGTLKVGDVLHIRAKAFCIAVNAAATQRIRLYLGTTALADSGAQSLIASDVVIIDLYLTVRTIGASGTFIATGTLEFTIAGTSTVTDITVASTAVDTTASQTLAVKALASASNAGNQIRLDEYEINLNRGDGSSSLFQADEAINNSAGSAAAFIRTLVV